MWSFLSSAMQAMAVCKDPVMFESRIASWLAESGVGVPGANCVVLRFAGVGSPVLSAPATPSAAPSAASYESVGMGWDSPAPATVPTAEAPPPGTGAAETPAVGPHPPVIGQTAASLPVPDLATATPTAGEVATAGAEKDSKEYCYRCGETTHYARDCARYKTVMCQRWQQGRCRRTAAACSFAHGDADRRDHAAPGAIECDNCGGPHLPSLCRRKPRAQNAYHDGPWCSWCETEAHDRDACPQKWCKTCETADHWTAKCPKCAHCRDWHNSRQCPYMVHRR